MSRPQPTSTLFPYTTLFRSQNRKHRRILDGRAATRVAAVRRHCWFHRKLAPVVDGQRDTIMTGMKDDFVEDRKSTRLNSSHVEISYAVFCLKKKKKTLTYTL